MTEYIEHPLTPSQELQIRQLFSTLAVESKNVIIEVYDAVNRSNIYPSGVVTRTGAAYFISDKSGCFPLTPERIANIKKICDIHGTELFNSNNHSSKDGDF